MDNAQFAKNIKEICKEQGKSVSKMLSICGIRKSLIYDLEKRDWTPSISVAEQIADYLECSVDFLIGRTDNPKATYKNIHSSNIVNVNGNNGNYSPLTVNKIPDENKELLELIQSLSLKQKANVITFIYKTVETEK